MIIIMFKLVQSTFQKKLRIKPSLWVLIALISLCSCAHQPISLQDLQQASIELSNSKESFQWHYLKEAYEPEAFLHWLNQQRGQSLNACICLPPEEPNSEHLMLGWHKLQPILEQAQQEGFNVTTELATFVSGPVIRFYHYGL